MTDVLILGTLGGILLFAGFCLRFSRSSGFPRSASDNGGWGKWNSIVSNRPTQPAHRTEINGALSTNPAIIESAATSPNTSNWTDQLICLVTSIRDGVKVSPESEILGTKVSSRDNVTLDATAAERDSDNLKTANSPVLQTVGSCAFAVLAVLLASILAECNVLWNGHAALAFFVLAVIVSASRGLGTGMLTTALSLIVMLVAFKENISMSNASDNILGVFFLIGVVTNGVFYHLQMRNDALVWAKAELEASNLSLRRHSHSLAEANARLAAQKIALADAHEQLRILSRQIATSIHRPLRTISEATDELIESDVTRFDASFCRRIKDEVERADMLVSELEQLAA